MTTPDRERVLASAIAELRSAYTIIVDPQCDPLTATPHLQRAWLGVAWLSRGELPDSPGTTLETWLAPEHLALVPEHSRAELHGVLAAVFAHSRDPKPWADDEPPPPLPKTRVLLRHLRALGSLVDALEQQQRGREPKLQLALRWGGRAALWAGAAAALVLVVLRPWQDEGSGPWRASYYPTKNFEGEPERYREQDVDFDWGVEPPTDTIPADSFSVRWDTCLQLEEQVDAAFQLVADDGARVYIDGKLIVDHWKKGRSKSKGKRLDIMGGSRHLRVEYYEHRGKAEVHLLASFDPDEAPAPIPEDMLIFPGMDFDEDENPCHDLGLGPPQKKKKNKKK